MYIPNSVLLTGANKCTSTYITSYLHVSTILTLKANFCWLISLNKIIKVKKKNSVETQKIYCTKKKTTNILINKYSVMYICKCIWTMCIF